MALWGRLSHYRQPVTARVHDLPTRDVHVLRAAVRGVRRGHAATCGYAAQYASLLRPTCCLVKDRDTLMAFYDFPATHWQQLRTTNLIESTFATIRHRTTRTKTCVTRDSLLHMMFKLGNTQALPRPAPTWAGRGLLFPLPFRFDRSRRV